MSHQVKKRKEINPHNIDKVPIKTGDLDRVVVPVSKPSPTRQKCEPKKQANADQKVKRVQPGHREIKPEKKLGVERIRSRPMERLTGHKLLHKFFVILDCFDT